MFKENKKGISTVIATLLLVVLTIVLVAIVWTVVNNFVTPKLSQSTSCFSVYNDLTLNNQYSCVNSSNPVTVRFSLNVGDKNIDGVLVSISSSSQSQSFTITNKPQVIANLSYYSGGNSVVIPQPDSGVTYIYNWTGSGIPSSIEVAPVVNQQQCSSSDSIQQLDDCNLLT